ncbi:hypothetical protein RIF29_29481 [Crotalaria pallida]|uniref:Uncharacterized protein n=1 Tax=Crotalaria pallida TaxID=3830 RepID=A0AAN9EF30_CROPI
MRGETLTFLLLSLLNRQPPFPPPPPPHTHTPSTSSSSPSCNCYPSSLHLPHTVSPLVTAIAFVLPPLCVLSRSRFISLPSSLRSAAAFPCAAAAAFVLPFSKSRIATLLWPNTNSRRATALLLGRRSATTTWVCGAR